MNERWAIEWSEDQQQFHICDANHRERIEGWELLTVVSGDYATANKWADNWLKNKDSK